MWLEQKSMKYESESFFKSQKIEMYHGSASQEKR